jgi:hypothetical protein
VADFVCHAKVFVATFLAVSAKFIILIFCKERVSQFITARMESIYTSIMEVSQRIRKKERSGKAMRFEH